MGGGEDAGRMLMPAVLVSSGGKVLPTPLVLRMDFLKRGLM